MSDYWMEDAECTYPYDHSRWIIGQDDGGYLWVPYRRAPEAAGHVVYWWRRFQRWNPIDQVKYWNSKRRNELAFLEWDCQ